MNTLARIADNYWLVRDEWANVVGVVARHSNDSYSGFMNGEEPDVLPNLDAVMEYTRSHGADHRLSPELITRLAIASSNR